MSAKRKRQDQISNDQLRPVAVLLEALKGDINVVHSALLQLDTYAQACRKSPESAPAKQLQKQLAVRDSLPELLEAFGTANSTNNKALIASLCSWTRSVMSFRLVDLANLQTSLARDILNDTASSTALHKALQPGHNEATASALSLIHVLISDQTEQRWSIKAKNAWNILSTDAKNLVRLLNVRHKNVSRSSKKLDIRTLLLGNFIPLLSPQSPVSIREDLLSIKGLVQAAVKGLAEDDTHVVYAVLHAFFLGGINEDRHSLDLRCQIVEESSQPLLNLAISSNADIAVHSQRFLLATVSTLTQPGSSHSHQQQQMQTTHLRARKCLNALLTAVRPGDHASHAELALCILRQCPELLSGFWQRIMPSLDPRLSSRWIAWITLATRIVCLPLPSHLAQSTSSDIALDLCFPPTFSQSWCSKGLLHESALVSYLVSLFLVACLQKFQTFLDLTNITAFNTSRHARKLTEQLADPKTVVTLLQKAVTESDVSKTEANLHLHTLLRLLLFYYQLAPELTASLRFDFTKLLEPILGHSASSSATMLSCQFTLLQLYMLPGVQVQWLKGSGSAMPIYMLCQVLLCSPESAIQQQAAMTISRILSHSNLFEPDQSAEIAIWVNALRASTTEESETISSLFSASLQKASNSVFKCIEETEDLDLSSNQPCSPLIAGWLQQLDYVRQHSKNDQHEHVAKFSARVVAGYAASHTLNSGLTLQKRVKRLVSKAWRSPLQLPLASLPESHAVEDTVTWDITRISSEPGIWNHRSVSEINSLRARLVAALWLASPSDRTSKDLIMAIANLLTQGQDLEEKAVEDVIAPMCRELVKTSKDNDEFLAEFLAQLREPLLALPVQSRQPIVVLFSKIALDPCAHVAALAALLPFAQEEDQSRAFEAFVRHNFLPRSAFETQCINALLASLRSRSQALRLPPDATSYLIKLHSACKVAQAGALLADVLGDQMPQATSTYPKQLIDQQAVAVANHWLKVVLSSPNFKEDPCDLRCLKPALALTGSDASKHVHGLCTKVIETQKDVSNVLDLVQFAAKIQRLTDDTATLLIPSLPKILAERFSSGCSLAAVLCKTVSLQSSVVDHVASVLKSKQPNEISASTVVSIAQLSNHLPTSHATHLISELLQKAYLWLVRRFAEDVEDTTETLSLVDSLNALYLSGKLDHERIKEHLAAPVVTAALQNRLHCGPVIELVCWSIKLAKSSSAGRWAQAILSHSRLRRAMAENSPTRLPILSILCALHQQLGKFSTPPELYNTLLAYYTGSTSKVDLEILATLTRADVSGIWSLRQQISNEPLRLMRTTEAAIGSLALTTIDSSMAHNTCQAIFADSQQQESPEVYDPELVLSLFAAFVAQPTIDVQDFLACVKSGSLGVLICCMFSSKKGISIGADRLLSRLRLRLQDADFVEKIEVMLVFHHAQRLVDASSSALSALFLVQACRAVASPEDEHYPTFLRYLLQRPALDFEDVPLLYPMLYPTDQSRAPIDRRWILQLLVDGTTSPKDWLALRRRQTWDLLEGLFLSQASTSEERSLIFKFLARAVKQDIAVADLVRRSGVFGFLRAAASSLSSIGGSHVFTVVLDILDSIKAQKLSSKADTLLLDAVRAVRALSLHQPQGVAFKLRALRKIAIMLPTSSQIWSAAISDELHQAMIVIIQSDVDNLPHLGIQELALLHDTCLRVSYHSSQSRIQKTTQARWLELLQKVSSHVSTSSSEILEMWSQKTHR